MASRRSLKKTVNYITELAAGLCLVESANANAEKREAYSEVFLQIINQFYPTQFEKKGE